MAAPRGSCQQVIAKDEMTAIQFSRPNPLQEHPLLRVLTGARVDPDPIFRFGEQKIGETIDEGEPQVDPVLVQIKVRDPVCPAVQAETEDVRPKIAGQRIVALATAKDIAALRAPDPIFSCPGEDPFDAGNQIKTLAGCHGGRGAQINGQVGFGVEQQ